MMQRKHAAVGRVILCLCSGISVIAGEAWIDADPLVAKTLRITASERKRLIRIENASVLTVRPVALPRGRYLKGKNKTLGWPVGIKIGKTLLCAYHQWLTHTGRPRRDDSRSDAVVVRSTDNGRTWSGPTDIRRFGVNSGKSVLGFGNCFGVLENTVFLATDYGLYTSTDEGNSWTLLRGALTQKQTGNRYSDTEEACARTGRFLSQEATVDGLDEKRLGGLGRRPCPSGSEFKVTLH